MKYAVVLRPRRPDEKDDTARIQEALTEAAKQGSVVSYEPGATYRISDTLDAA